MSNFPLREMNLTRLHLLSVLPDFFFFFFLSKMRQKYLLHCSGYSFTFTSLLYICHSEPLQMARSPVHYILLLFSCFTLARHPVHYIHHLLSHFRIPVSCTFYPTFTHTFEGLGHPYIILATYILPDIFLLFALSWSPDNTSSGIVRPICVTIQQ